MNDLENFLSTNGGSGNNIDIDDATVTIFIKLLVILYADDTIILSDNVNDFQQMLNIFSDFCNSWKLKINSSKTKIMIFGDRSRTPNVPFFDSW